MKYIRDTYGKLLLKVIEDGDIILSFDCPKSRDEVYASLQRLRKKSCRTVSWEWERSLGDCVSFKRQGNELLISIKNKHRGDNLLVSALSQLGG